MYGPKMVWLFPGWYGSKWWEIDSGGDDCSQAQIELVVEGAVMFGSFKRNPNTDQRGVAGLTAGEFDDQYHEYINHSSTYTSYEYVAAPCYDSVWLAALVFNNTINVMAEQGTYT
jgi:hypothetical protein